MALPSLYIVLLVLSLIGPTTLALEMGPVVPISECAKGRFAWRDGQPPYTVVISILSSNTVVVRDDLNDTVFHWVASIPAGTEMIFDLSDSDVAAGKGSRITNTFAILPGRDSCRLAATSSTTQQTADTSATSPTSTSGQRPTTSETQPLPPASDSTTKSNLKDTTSSPSSTDGSPSGTLTGSMAGTENTGSAGNTAESTAPAGPGGSSSEFQVDSEVEAGSMRTITLTSSM